MSGGGLRLTGLDLWGDQFTEEGGLGECKKPETDTNNEIFYVIDECGQSSYNVKNTSDQSKEKGPKKS